MILASHNSWTYLPPKKWWMRLFNFVAKCQDKNIKQQYYNGARMFDLRVRFDNYGYPIIAHGLAEYSNKCLTDDLIFLNEKGKDTVYVRVILETNEESYGDEVLFTNYCASLRNKYENIRFIGGNRKYDWEKVFDFDITEPAIKGVFASVTDSKIDDVWPWLYAKRNNNKNLKGNENYNGYLMVDFI